MNSDLMPSPESSNSTTSQEEKTNMEAATADSNTSVAAPKNEQSVTPSENASDGNEANRQHPIPPPSEPMQYRAIGLVLGRYVATEEQFTQGTLLTPDGIELNAVLLGRIMSLVKNHLDLEKDHLWVVYPRTRQENDKLHMQIVGVWEPENLAKPVTESDSEAQSEEVSKTDTNHPEVEDGDFSVRGEVVYQSPEGEDFVVKIKQAPRKPTDKPKYFKLKLKGKLDTKAVGKFWDFEARRDGELLLIEKAEFIADLPKKRRPPFNKGGGGGRGRFAGKKPFQKRPGGQTPLPVKKSGQSPGTAVEPKKDTPKPIKRQKPPE